MKLKILGSVSPYPKLNNNCPGYLIYDDNYRILLDCGNGITRLMKFPDDLNNLNIVLSHLHKDHYGDLGAIAYASYVYHNLGLLDKKINVYVPYSPLVEDYNYIMNFGNLHYMNFYTYDEANKININGIDISFKKTKHSIVTYAVNVSDSISKISYSADTGFDTELASFFKDADILLCETSFLKSQKNDSINYHLDTIDAANLAKLSNVQKLVLTHFWPEIDKERYLEEVIDFFPNTEVALEDNIYTLKHKKRT